MPVRHIPVPRNFIRYGSIRTCDCCNRSAMWVSTRTHVVHGPTMKNPRREHLCNECHTALKKEHQ